MKLEAIVGNTAFDLSNRVEYIHLSNTGWGIPQVSNYAESGPLQNGATYIDFRLEPRDLQIVIGVPASTFDDYMARRKQLFNIFKPKRNTPLHLRTTFDNGDIRQLDVVYTEGLEADGNDKSGYYHKYAIGLRAHDPTWYDPILVNVPFGVVSASGFDVPMSVPLAVGVSTIDQTVSIAYNGTSDSFPIISVIGPCTDLSISNDTTGDTISISGNIPAGDIWTIDTRYGYKTITDQNGINKISQYSGDLATFRLMAAEDDTNTYVNDITVTSLGSTAQTRVFIQYFTRYIGL